MPDYSVARRGTDSSGRPILATGFMWEIWQAILARPRVRPFAWKVVVVQGAFMVRLGGGASASAGYHDLGGCFDIRTWNLTQAEQDILWWEAGLFAFYLWKRDRLHGGMDEHGHSIAGWDAPLAPGASYQWRQVLNGRDGLASNGPDYHPRPRPLAIFPPVSLLQEDDMFDVENERRLARVEAKLDELTELRSDLADIAATLDEAQQGAWKRFKAERDRDRRAAQKARESKAELVSAVAAVVDQITATATADQLGQAKRRLLRALAEDPDVDGPDDPVLEGSQEGSQ